MNNFNRVLAAFTLLLFGGVGSAFSQALPYHWAKGVAGPGIQFSTAIAQDTVNDAIYVTGFIGDTTVFGLDTLIVSGSREVFLAKYDPSGLLLWVIQSYSNSNPTCNDVVVDELGNVYLVGDLSDSLVFDTTGIVPPLVPMGSSADVFIAKFDPDGNAIDGYVFGSIGNDEGSGLAIDATTLYVTGTYFGDLVFPPTADDIDLIGNSDAFLIATDRNSLGSVAWKKRVGSVAGGDLGQDVAVNALGVFLVGNYDSDDVIVAANHSPATPTIDTVLTHTAGVDFFLVQYDLSGTFQWAISGTGPNEDRVNAVAVQDSNVYLTGRFQDSLYINDKIGTSSLASLGGPDIFIAKVSAGGLRQWSRSEGGLGLDEGTDIAVSPFDEVCITGNYSPPALFDTINMTGVGTELMVSCLQSDGTFRWIQTGKGNGSNIGQGVTTDGYSVYFTGVIGDTATFGPFEVAGVSTFDIAVGKFSCSERAGVIAASSSIICPGDFVTLSISGYIGDASMLWQESPAGTFSWNIIPGGTAPVLVTDPTYDTDYRVLTGSGSCLKDTTPTITVSILPIDTVVCQDTLLLPAGSMVIAMDNVNQARPGPTPFNFMAYGLVVELLANQIPVHWVIRQDKNKDEVDMYTNCSRIFPSATPAADYAFRSGPFVIHKDYDSLATAIISAYGNGVNVYALTASDTALVKFTLSQTPKAAILSNGSGSGIHVDGMTLAGIDPSHYDVIPGSAVLDGNSCYTFASEGHWDAGPVSPPEMAEMNEVKNFVQGGGNFFAQCDAVITYENSQLFQTTAGMQVDNVDAPNMYYSPALPIMQFEGETPDNPISSSTRSFRNNGGSYVPTSHSLIDKPSDIVMQASEIKITPNSEYGGYVWYQGGHDYSDAAVEMDPLYNNGLRMYLNAFLTPAKRPESCGLNFATDIEISATILTPPPYCPGKDIDIAISVWNSSLFGATSSSLVIHDSVLTSGLTALPIVPPAVGTFDSATGIWNLPPMAPNEKNTLLLSYTLASTSAQYIQAELASIQLGNSPRNDTILLEIPANDSAWSGIALSPMDSICTGDSIDLNLVGAEGSIQWQASLDSMSGWTDLTGATDSTFTLASDSVQYFQAVVTKLSCPDTSNLIMINVAAVPVANVPADYDLCNETSTLLITNAPPAGTGTWESSGPTLSIVDDTSASATGLAAGVNTFDWIVTNGSCPNDTASLAVTVFNSSGGTLSALNDSLCDGESTSLLLSGYTGSIAWESSLSGTAPWTPIGGSAPSLSTTPATDIWYHAITTTGPCLDTSTIQYISLSNLPVASVPAGYTVCNETTTLLLTETPVAGTGTWVSSGAAFATFLDDTSATATGMVPGPNDFYWVVENGPCPEDSALLTVTVAASNPGTVSPATDSLCMGESTTFSLSGHSGSIVWESAPSAMGPWSSVGGTTPSISTTPIGDTWFQAIVTTGPCLDTSAAAIAYVSEIPVANVPADMDLCNETTAILQAINPFPGKGVWESLTGLGVTEIDDSSASVTGLVTGINNFQWIVSNGTCPPDTADYAVTVYTADPGILSPLSSVLCQGSSLDLNLTGASGPPIWQSAPAATGPWTPVAGTGSTLSVSPSGSTWYQAVVSSGPCNDSSEIAEIAVEIPPSPSDAGEHQSICLGNTVTLNGNSPTSGMGVWTLESGSATIDSPIDPNSLVTGLDTGQHVLAWTISSGTACPDDSSHVQISVYGIPGFTAGDYPNICDGEADAVLLSAEGGGNPGLWTVLSGGSELSAANIPDPVATGLTPGSNVFEWQASISHCTFRDTATIDLISDFAEAGPDQLIVDASSTTLDGNTPVSPGIGTWSFLYGSGVLDNPNSPGSSLSDMVGDSLLLLWTISNGGCEWADSMKIKLLGISIPEAFSPNDDGVHDVFTIHGLEYIGGQKSLTVFNRWGNIVFRDTGYNNDWTGINKGGQPLSDDTYFYVIEIEGLGNFKGTVTLKR